MAVLLALLERDRRRPRLFAGAIAAGAILVAAAGTMVVRHKDPCDAVGDEVAGAWNPARAFVIRATFVAAGGGAGWPAAQTTLDTYASDLIGVARGACRASRRGGQAQELTDARESCVYRARARLDAIAGGLTGASRRTVGGALEELRTLPDLAECADHGLVKLAFPSEPSVRFRAAVLESALTEAQASMYAHVPQPADELDRFVAMAKAIGGPSLEAFSIDMRGRAAFASGDLILSRASYEAATHLFVEAGEDANAAKAMLDLADSNAESGHFDDAEHWTRLAESLVHRLSDPPAFTSRIAGLDAQLDEGRGQFREAAKLRRRQVELSRQAYHDVPNEIIDHQNLAFAAHDDGDPVEMERESRAGRALVERELGADHPQTVFFDTFDASAFVDQGRLADAEHAARHMIAVATKWYGADSSDAMGGWMNLAGVLERRGEIAEYVAANDRALAIANLRDPNSTTAGKLETNVATALAMQNKLAEAKPHGERAAAILERLIGADSFDLVNLVITRAYIARGLGELDDSRRLLEHAVAISDKADHDRVNPRIELSYTLVLMKRAPDAVKELYAVAPIAASQATEPRIAAEYHLALAKALVETGAHDRAFAEAMTSRDAFAGLGSDFVPQRDEAAAWLQAHR
jgi:serine/threonine-protein kinase